VRGRGLTASLAAAAALAHRVNQATPKNHWWRFRPPLPHLRV